MAHDEALEQPEVHAVVVAGSVPGTEAVDVLVAWHDLEAIEGIAQAVLDQIRDELAPAPTFAGEVTFYLSPDDVPATPETIAKLGLRLTMGTMLWRTQAGKPWTVRVVHGVAPA